MSANRLAPPVVTDDGVVEARIAIEAAEELLGCLEVRRRPSIVVGGREFLTDDLRTLIRAASDRDVLVGRIAELEAQLKLAECQHNWEWVKTSVEADGVTNHVTMRCAICGLTRTDEHRAQPSYL